MIRSHTFRICLGLALLGAVGAGFYLYQNLPELLRVQAQRYLQQYGVEDIEFEGLSITHSDASVDSLMLRGTYENYAYEVRLASGEVLYDWRVLLGAEMDSLSVSSLALSIEQTGEGSSTAQEPIVLDSLVPHRLVAQLPIASLSVPQWSLSYRSPKLQPIAASGSIVLNQQLDATLATTLAGREILVEVLSDIDSGETRLSLSLAANEEEIAGEQQAAIATFSAQGVNAVDDRWQWNIQGRVQFAPTVSWLREIDTQQHLALGFPPAEEFAARGESNLSAQINHPDDLSLDAGPGSVDALLQQLKASFQLSNDIRQLDIRDLVTAATGTVTIDGNVNQGRIQTTLQPFKFAGEIPAQLLALPDDWVQWLQLKNDIPVAVELVEPLHIASPLPGQWSMQTNNAQLSLGGKESRISVQKLNLDTTVNLADQLDAKTTLSAVLNTRLQKQTVPSLQIALSQQGSAENNTFNLRLADTAESMHANLEGTHSLVAETGNYQLNAQITDVSYLWASISPLLRHFKILQDTVAFRSGSMRLDSTLVGKTYDTANWQQRSQITLENTAGSVNEYQFDGLSLTAQWSGIERWKTLAPLDVSLDRLALGFEIQEIHLRASLPKPTAVALPNVRIEAFSAKLFGGRLTLPERQQWDFAASSNNITLQAQQWQLGELVALQQNADIQAVGKLEGELPLTIADGRVIIEKGYLRALPPGGSIRYNATDEARALANSNPELKLALNLLSDFQYQVLSSKVELDKAGNLLLGLSLEGSNPTLYEGQPVNFNINLEQNIDPLLQSLRLSDNLVKEIEGGLK
ncbi:Uncharacterised protein [Halioglobus japonicus]|nr:Uncharacterised protein [Halioglobus japonicus]